MFAPDYECHSLLAKAHAILSLSKPEIDALHAMASTHLNRFLWLREGEGQDIFTAGDENGGEAFLNAYRGAVWEILELRRNGQRLMMGFESRETASKFAAELRAYESEIHQRAATTGPWARGLPQTLFWALGFLRRFMPANRRPDDESLIATSFAAARRLVENHNDQVLAITRASLLADRHRLAGRIVDEMAKAESPQTFRDIARYTHKQKKAFVAPVVEALIDVGVLAGMKTVCTRWVRWTWRMSWKSWIRNLFRIEAVVETVHPVGI